MRVINSPASTSSHLKCSISFRPIWGCTTDRWVVTRPPAEAKYTGQKNAVDGGVFLAQTATAEVTFDSATINGGQLQADVRVQNLAGHNFPSGVSFRRAFVDFQVLDADGNVLWESGGTNGDGVITDTAGIPLPTEFFSPSQQTFQPHFWTGNPITSDEQVQIYEEKVRDPQGQLTTSFLSLDNKVKDNRIQPQGWSSQRSQRRYPRSGGHRALIPSYQRRMRLQRSELPANADGRTHECGESPSHFVLSKHSSLLSARARRGR